MSFQLVIIWDDRGDEHEIAVSGSASYEEAEAKAFQHARNVMGSTSRVPERETWSPPSPPV